MNINKFLRKAVATALSCTMLFVGTSSLCINSYAADATQKKYEEQIDALKQTQKELQNKIEKSKKEAGKAAENKAYLDELIYTIEAKITASEALVSELSVNIKNTKEDIEVCEEELEKSKAKFADRMRMLQDSGQSNYLSILFGAESISDFLSRVEHVVAMLEYDRKLSAEYKAEKEELERIQADLEKAIELQNETLASLEKDRSDAEKLSREAEKYLNELQADAASYQAQLNKAQKAKDELDRELTKYLSSLKNQNSSQVVAGGAYQWPLPVGKGWITCKFGGSDPNNKPHYALDVAISAGTPIYATNDGTVLISGYHDSYGYYILLDHGNGMASLYAHCSALLVSKGQTVAKGQTIGRVGTTGFSKGNHLHFEIRKNGTRVDPLKYMAPQAPENIL